MRHATASRTTALALVFLAAACSSDPPKKPAAPEPPAQAAQGGTSAAPEANTDAPHTGLDLDDPAQCAACHGQVVREWTESMHSQAHHSRDPIYAKMRALRSKLQGAQITDGCANCHTPRRDLGERAEVAGVSCASCHNVDAVNPDARGAKALKRAPAGVLRGPHDLTGVAGAPHGVGAAPAHMTDGATLCLACHGEHTNSEGVPVCTTGVELASAPKGALKPERSTCVACHMPRVAGPSGVVSARKDHASHAFLGPHRAWLQDDPSVLQDAVELSAAWQPDGGLALTVRNKAGHSFPSGFPGRVALIQAVGFDAKGAEVWRAWREDPLKEQPALVFNKVYTDAEGKPTLPPMSVALKRDSRLKPGEARDIGLTPPKSAVTVKATLLYRLIPPPMAQKLGLSADPIAAPKQVTTTRATRGDSPPAH